PERPVSAGVSHRRPRLGGAVPPGGDPRPGRGLDRRSGRPVSGSRGPAHGDAGTHRGVERPRADAVHGVPRSGGANRTAVARLTRRSHFRAHRVTIGYRCLAPFGPAAGTRAVWKTARSGTVARHFLWIVRHSSSAVPGTGRRDGRVSNGPLAAGR